MNAAAGREVTRGVVEEEVPFGRAPNVVRLVIVETDHVGGDDIEAFRKLGQRFVAFDARDDARNAEQFRKVVEHGRLIEIEPEDVVSEPLADVEEVAGAAADIEDAFPRAAIEIEVTNAADVHLDPAPQFEIFFGSIAGIGDGVALMNGAELRGIDARDDGVGINPEDETPGEQDAVRVPLHALGQAGIGELFDLVKEAHRSRGPTS